MRDLSSSVLGRRYASLTTAVIAGLLLSVFTFGGQAGAWVTPTLTANCAPDASHYSWTVNLHPESNQKIEMSWGTGAFTTFQTTDFGSAGAHTFTTPRVATTLAVRYASDTNVKTSAMANNQICGSGTTNGGTLTGDRPGGPTGNNGDVKIHESTTAVQDHQNQPHVCTFYIDAFNFDKASNGTWRIEQWAPTGSGVAATGSWGPADNEGNWHSASMTLADGHYKLFFKQTGTQGGEKQKVFWVECGKTAGERSKGNENENDDQDTDSHVGSPTGGTERCTGVATLKEHSEITGAITGGVAKVTFTMGAGCTGQELTLVSYTAPAATFSRDTASEQKIFEYQTGTFGTGSYTLAVHVPSCFFQVDFVSGAAIEHIGPADSSNFYSDQGRLIEGLNGGATGCTESNSGTGGGGTVVTGPTTDTNGGTGSTGGSTPAGNRVAGFETAPNAVGSVTPIVDVGGGSTQQSPNGAVAGAQTSPVAGLQSLPSTSTDRTPTVPLAALGLAIMALGAVLLRRRDMER